jgi:hypothetical protein
MHTMQVSHKPLGNQVTLDLNVLVAEHNFALFEGGGIRLRRIALTAR